MIMVLFPVDDLERLLIAQARSRQSVSYGEVFRWFGLPFQRFQVGQLSAALAIVDDRQRALSRPELAVLVVRQSDGLPGQGWWLAQAPGSYSGPFEGPKAARFVRRVQKQAYDWWRRHDEAQAAGKAGGNGPEHS